MRIAIVVSALSSALYASTIAWGAFPGHWLVKAAAIAALAMLVRRSPLLVCALLLCATGDALLSVNLSLFVHGLAAFLCGHIAYTAAFLRTEAGRPLRPASIAVPVLSLAFYMWLQPSLGSLGVPVFLYVVAITTMVVTSQRMGTLVMAGAILFLVSDCVLATNRFRAEVPLGGYIVWLTYYFGQLAIATGCSMALGDAKVDRRSAAASA